MIFDVSVLTLFLLWVNYKILKVDAIPYSIISFCLIRLSFVSTSKK